MKKYIGYIGIIVILLVAIPILFKPSRESYIMNNQGDKYVLSDSELNKLDQYIVEVLDKKEECERIKMLYSNTFTYYDKAGKKQIFKFTDPKLITSEKESMIIMDDKSYKINQGFYEKLEIISTNSIEFYVD